MNTKFYSKDIKNFPSSTGIYCISFKNSKSKKVYIGSASQNSNKTKSANGFYSRWRKHLHLLRNNNHHSSALQNAYNKYGDDNIEFVIIEVCGPAECIVKEQFYIDKYNSFKKGYNGRPLSNSNLGFKQSEKQKNILKQKYKDIRDSFSNSVIKMYNENKTTRDISKILNISRGVIKKIFKENNISGKNAAFYKKKKIFQYELNGKFIKEWDNINECCCFIKTSSNSIRNVISGRCKHAKGFYFSSKILSTEEILSNINIISIKSKNRKYLNIKQLDDKKCHIKTWRDVKEIVECFKLSNTVGIIRALKGERDKYKGFYWTL